MPSIKQTGRGSVIVRRSNSVRPMTFVGLDDGSATDYMSDLRSISQSDETSTDDGDIGAQVMMWDLNKQQERMRGFDDVANKLLLPEDTELMIKNFEKAEDIPFCRTYQLGMPVGEFSESTASPRFGIVLLPGADLPEVSRLEQSGMVDKAPDQKDARWRVSTAGEMLTDIYVTQDMKVTSNDITTLVARCTLDRMTKGSQHKGSFRHYRTDAVTIESENVEILHDFSLADPKRPLDLFATLIEVNVSSLWSLMTDYKQIIKSSGPQMTIQQNKDLLDRMIDAARRFCVKSPILFRMSTRVKIIRSNNTRYGVDSEHIFRAFTTSKGIQEIIMTSASYYSALDPDAPGMDEGTQAAIRPRYLQMLTLLLSLLNDEDLRGTAEFLRRTYGLIPERPDMELLFLKVIPLTSINSKVFLQGLIPAVERWPVPEYALSDESEVWRSFISRLANRGYLLPATVEQLGHSKHSWVAAWPSDGIHSSTAFSRLQRHGEKTSTFNEITATRFKFEPDLKELTVILTDDTACTIHPKDYEQISSLTKGIYSITKDSDKSICDLEISENLLNGSINEAIRIVNEAIKAFNIQATPTNKTGRKLGVWRGRPSDPMVFRELPPANRLTRNEARLDGNKIAVAYKLGGRNVPKAEALRYMAAMQNFVVHLFNRLCEATGKHYVHYEKYIQMVNHLLVQDRTGRNAEKQLPPLSDAPIAQTLGVDDDIPSKKIWHEYHIRLVNNPRYLHELLEVKSRADFVSSVEWRKPGERAEVKLAATPTRFFVAPLHAVDAVYQNDEISVGDLALLVGKYIVIATPQTTQHGERDYTGPCILINWLEIVDEYAELATSRRGRNFQAKEVLPTTTFI